MANSHERFDVVVIGAGHNGLVAAGYLARAGKKVMVVEQRDRVSGACTLEEPFPGFTMSPCAPESDIPDLATALYEGHSTVAEIPLIV